MLHPYTPTTKNPTQWQAKHLHQDLVAVSRISVQMLHPYTPTANNPTQWQAIASNTLLLVSQKK